MQANHLRLLIGLLTARQLLVYRIASLQSVLINRRRVTHLHQSTKLSLRETDNDRDMMDLCPRLRGFKLERKQPVLLRGKMKIYIFFPRLS